MNTTIPQLIQVDDFTTNMSDVFHTVAEGFILSETSDHLNSEINYVINSTWLANMTMDKNISIYIDDIHISRMENLNETVFSGYPRALLCFGAVCFVTFAIIGVLGNLISILALSRCTRLRNATTAFIVNLCFADLLFCSFSMPLSAIQFIDENWYFGEVLCKLFALFRYSNGAVSLFSVIAITVNRYILIVHPKIYPAVYKRRNIAFMIAFIWIMSFFLLMFPLLEIWGTLGYDPNVGTCTILKHNGKSPKMFLYITAFGLPSIIFIACYTRIFLAVRKTSRRASRKEDNMISGSISFTAKKGWLNKSFRHSEMPKSYTPHRDRKELRVLRVMLVIFILFILCYFPVSFVKIFQKEENLKYLNVLGYLGVYFSNIINPVIYIVMSKEYRRAYKELFCRSKVKRQTLTVSYNR